MGNTKKKQLSEKVKYAYPKFSLIDGNHPFKEAVPDSFVEYQVRKRHGGKITIFNFELAKEMGLIPKDHPNKMNKHLEKIIMETFSLIIINEYDRIHKIKFPKEDIKPHKYMATRYLQLQHPDKKGKTSGDGRSMWNGQISHRGITWDISSCGTGATCLSPATHVEKKFFKTGDPSVSYGCGYSEKDEGLSSIFFSEVLHLNKIETERVLGIIEFHGGSSINIRVGKNLIRPSHVFQHLKQNNKKSLKKIVDYYIERQVANKEWQGIPAQGKKRYNAFLKKITSIFAKTAACFEDEYIFCWMDWDGDNILMDGGIIDYGSIRQFGLFHHEYRYDDVDRFSTSIVEQKNKAKYIVQTFAQIVDYIVKENKESIDKYTCHPCIDEFDKIFKSQKNSNLVYKMGFNDQQREFILKNLKKDIKEFRKAFSYFEKVKSKKGMYKVADGITWDAVFCMRDILRELPSILMETDNGISRDEFIQIIKSNYARPKDLERNHYFNKKIDDFQNLYMKIIDCVAKGMNIPKKKLLLHVTMRSSIINKYDRVTGDSITTIVEKIINHRPKIVADQMYNLLRHFIEYQNFNPNIGIKSEGQQYAILKKLIKIVRDYRDGL